MAELASEKMVEPSLSTSPSLSMDRTPSRRVSDASASDSSAAGTPNRPSSLDRSSSSSRQLDYQNQLFLKSEEYRQLFRLPQEEVLIQDFNCALQENFLLQGHMYLFAHYICFYSNLFGFETKKIIPFHEVTSVRRAKAAAIFPTAIEILAGGKKFFFTSFLSRDEAFKLINDGWSENNNDVKSITDEQESNAGLNGQENGGAIVEKVDSSRQLMDESSLTEREKDGSTPEDVEPLDNEEAEIVSTSIAEQDNAENNVEIVQNTDSSSSWKSLSREPVDLDPPGVPGGHTMVAESKFPVNVEEFFQLFLSDHAVDFQESFHRKCGDKDFKCTEWHPHEKYGYTRDVSFQHPIKLYLGAKFGSCQAFQQYQVYKNWCYSFHQKQISHCLICLSLLSLLPSSFSPLFAQSAFLSGYTLALLYPIFSAFSKSFSFLLAKLMVMILQFFCSKFIVQILLLLMLNGRRDKTCSKRKE